MDNKIIKIDSEGYVKKYNYTPNGEDIRFTSIIIITYNQLGYTKLCIESIKKFTHKDCYEIIIVDNNSTDGTVEWLKKQEDLKVIYNEDNKGFPVGCNQGIQVSKGESILLLNNDTIVTPNWLNNMNKALYSSDSIGAVGAVSNSCSNYQQIVTSYDNVEEMIQFAQKYNISNENVWKLKTKLIGFCLLLKKSAVDKVGLLDERFTPGNFEDDDYCYRMICEGYKLLLCKDVFIHHFGSISFGKNNRKFVEIFKNNSKKFQDKWGFDSSYSSTIRTEIIDIIEDDKEKPLNILEVGCGIGATLLEIKNIYKNANIYGVEISTGAGEIAKNICNCIIGNIEKEELPYNKNFFDYIILGDVLEHLQDPWKTLQSLKKYLKGNGYVIASIPNIMHVSVISKLLKGSFSYVEAGILDKTHLRFFTLEEIEKLFSSNKYEISLKKATIIALSKEEEEFINKLCSISDEKFRSQYSNYQYIVKARPIVDLSVLEEKEIFNLRLALLNLDYKKDIPENLDIIFNMYDKYKDILSTCLEYLINSSSINKEEIKKQILQESRKRNINIFLK